MFDIIGKRFWYFLISLSATVPGLNRWGFFVKVTVFPPFDGALPPFDGVLAPTGLTADVFFTMTIVGDFFGCCLVLAIPERGFLEYSVL